MGSFKGVMQLNEGRTLAAGGAADGFGVAVFFCPLSLWARKHWACGRVDGACCARREGRREEIGLWASCIPTATWRRQRALAEFLVKGNLPGRASPQLHALRALIWQD